ncbi:hypothetical protein, partial [Enterococcus cecorum]|uniref:hypothetical protein n=1 Tax=Enterococcus cecorum TaxID=44008 RepID=UPI001FAD68D9
ASPIKYTEELCSAASVLYKRQKDINLLLELRVDSQMCFDLSEKERKKYIKSLILVAKKINHSHKNQS